MKKISWILMFILGFFVVFAISAVVTFLVTLDRDEPAVEDATEEVYQGGSVLPEGNTIDAETAVTRVTPSLSVADAIIVRTVYTEKVEESSDTGYAMPEVEDLPIPVVETKKEVKTEENKAEEKNEEVKTEEKPKLDEKKEEVKAEEPKVEEKKEEEEKAEEPKSDEQNEEVKVEEPKVELDPNKQYSDTGL